MISHEKTNSIDKELHELDIRILSITISLALFFFVRAFIDFL